MARTLNLTSPTMKGDDVKKMQKALATSVFGNFKPGAIDGEYGESTAGAVRRARRWLGYSNKEVNSPKFSYRAGDRLYLFLTGKKALPATFRLRRKMRLRSAGKTPLRLKMLAEAKKHIGTKESPANSNKVLFSKWYGMIGPWCLMFVSYCGVKAGSKKTFKQGSFYAYTPFIVRDARLGARGMALVSKDKVQPGHVVMFDFERGGTKGSEYNTDHTGLFDKWLDKGKGTFRTIEGNTSFTNNANGGEVIPRDRDMGQVIAFIQVEL